MFEIITIKLNDHDRWTYHTPKKKKKNHQFVVRTLDSLVNYIFLYNIHVFFFFLMNIYYMLFSLCSILRTVYTFQKRKKEKEKEKEREWSKTGS